ncbi:MAG TPA: VanZ family protein [Vicinamibacterales bacterium]
MRRARLFSVIASAIVIVSAAYVGDMTAAIRRAFPGQYGFVVGGLVVTAVTAAVGVVAARIREHRVRRYGTLLLALAGAAAYFATFRTGNAEVDAVEAFHFLEYGALAFLFYRASRAYSDARRLAFPLLGGLLAGLLDETLQWFIASRVGELHDVALDLAAVSFGLVVALAVDPPPRSVISLDRHAAWHVGAYSAGVLVVFAAFLQAVHVGHEIHDPEIGVFRSGYDAAALQRLARARAQAWQNGVPKNSGRFAREDHYLTEALWHVAERNDAVDLGDTLTAWRENRILEKFYSPLLEIPAVSAPYRWPAEQRAMMADLAAHVHGAAYVSRANPLPIYVF